MSAKRKRSVNSSPRDEAPEISKECVAGAELRRGTKLVRRGRPPTPNPNQLLSLRLPPEVIAEWKAKGPGWQTRMAEVLKKSTPKTYARWLTGSFVAERPRVRGELRETS